MIKNKLYEISISTGAGHIEAGSKETPYGLISIGGLQPVPSEALCNAVIATEAGTRTITIKERLNKLHENTKHLRKSNSKVFGSIASATVSSTAQKQNEREQI